VGGLVEGEWVVFYIQNYSILYFYLGYNTTTFCFIIYIPGCVRGRVGGWVGGGRVENLMEPHRDPHSGGNPQSCKCVQTTRLVRP
jgi:hypothetical protein